jgi:peptidyl-prolyl cis-trans isomerase D
MIKVIRQRTIENPIFFRGIMFLLAVTFAISLGWWGVSDDGAQRNIAEVGEDSISLDAYSRAYKNASRFYSQILKAPFKEEDLRKQVLDQMVDQKLWLQEAVRMNLHVTDDELKESIIKLPGFQENGQFNAEVYRGILAREKMTPEQFEGQQRDSMMIEKAKSLIRDATALTPHEIEELKKSNPPKLDQEQLSRLNRKREKVVRSYTIGLKQKFSVTIHDDLL